MTHRGTHARTSAQRSASARNLEIARKKHRKPNETAAQLRQRREALLHARAILLSEKRPPSAKMKAAEEKWEEKGEAKYIALGEAAWKRGEALWVARGRAAWERRSAYGTAGSLSPKISPPFRTSLKAPMRHPLGAHEIAFSLRHTLTIRKPTGVMKSFVKEIAPTGYGTRTTWHKASRHHYHAHIRQRKPRRMPLGHWRRRKRRITPR